MPVDDELKRMIGPSTVELLRSTDYFLRQINSTVSAEEK